MRTSRHHRRPAATGVMVAAVAAAAASSAAVIAPHAARADHGAVPDVAATAPGPACSARYTVPTSWPGGFQARVTITNTGPALTGTWRAAIRMPDDVPWVYGHPGTWSVAWSPGGATITGTGTGLPSYASVTVILEAAGTTPYPTSITLNGTPCQGTQPPSSPPPSSPHP